MRSQASRTPSFRISDRFVIPEVFRLDFASAVNVLSVGNRNSVELMRERTANENDGMNQTQVAPPGVITVDGSS
eukprot:m.578050 g.578050  ORF g.578050 m.578050 type:complete len:74 (-) comp57916_c0_seq41:1454-1675(-)